MSNNDVVTITRYQLDCLIEAANNDCRICPARNFCNDDYAGYDCDEVIYKWLGLEKEEN